VKLNLQHRYDCDVDTFWDKVFFNEEYVKRLHVEGLRFKDVKIVEMKDEGGKLSRTIRVDPKFDAPAVVQKILGDLFFYTEVGTFDRATKRWSYTLTPSVLSDRVTIRGDIWCDNTDKGLNHVADLEIDVRVFGIGSILESFTAKENRDGYQRATDFTNRWLREKGLAKT
jgi:hypothetical protein